MHKNQKIIALFATIGWLAFIIAAFHGFHFWYEGFIVFFFVALGVFNWNSQTSIWLLIKKPKHFWIFYAFLIVFFFFVDFILGQKIANLWQYPYHNTFGSLLRIYLMYPLAGLAVLESLYLISGVFRVELEFKEKKNSLLSKIIDKIELYWLVVTLFIPAILFIFEWKLIQPPVFLVYAAIAWILLYSFKLYFHLKHGLHWLSMFLLTALLSVAIHELPNLAVFEWKYGSAPIFNQVILGVPLWVIIAWYLFVILMLRFWLFVSLRNQPD